MFVARDARGELVNVLEDKLEKQAYTLPSLWRSAPFASRSKCPDPFAHKSLKDCDFSSENEKSRTLGK